MSQKITRLVLSFSIFGWFTFLFRATDTEFFYSASNAYVVRTFTFVEGLAQFVQ